MSLRVDDDDLWTNLNEVSLFLYQRNLHDAEIHFTKIGQRAYETLTTGFFALDLFWKVTQRELKISKLFFGVSAL